MKKKAPWFLIMLFLSNSIIVNAQCQSSILTGTVAETYTVSIPKDISLADKTTPYSIEVSGNISPQTCVSVTPENNTIELINDKVPSYTNSAHINQDKIVWSSLDVKNKTVTKGSIILDEEKVGKFHNTINFNIKTIENSLINESIKTLWIWDKNEMINANTIVAYCKKLDISRVYQCFSVDNLNSETMNEYLQTMHNNEIEVYWTNGTPTWAVSSESAINDVLIPIANYNNVASEKIDGIMFDNEIYTLPDYENHINQYNNDFVRTCSEYYDFCKANNLKLAQCINCYQYYQYPDIYIDIIKNCDYVSVMTYANNRQYHLINEIQKQAQNNGKDIEIITQFGTDVNARDNIEEAQQEWNLIQSKLEYTNMLYSYHYYNDYFKGLVEL